MKKPWKTVIWCCVAAALLWWFFPRPLAPGGGEVGALELGSGLTGRQLTMEEPAEMEVLVDTLHHTYYIRLAPQLFSRLGFCYTVDFYDAQERQLRHVTVQESGVAFVDGTITYLIGAGGFGKLNDILRAYTAPTPAP